MVEVLLCGSANDADRFEVCFATHVDLAFGREQITVEPPDTTTTFGGKIRGRDPLGAS